MTIKALAVYPVIKKGKQPFRITIGEHSKIVYLTRGQLNSFQRFVQSQGPEINPKTVRMN